MHFLEKLADHILSTPKEDLKNLVVVLPNMRAKLFLNEHLKRKAKTALFLPVSYSSQELMEKLSGMKSADDFLLLSKLYKAYPKSKDEEMTFDLFMNWGNSLLQDIKEIDHQLVDADALFKELSDIRRMEAWSPDASALSDIQRKYLTFCQRLPTIYQTFQSEMIEDGTGHLGFLEKVAFQNIKKNNLGAQNKFIIAGFNALTKAEEGIFDWISDHHSCVYFWDYDHYYLDDSIHEAGHFGRINQQKFKASFNWVFNDYSEIDKKVSIYKCTTGYEQSFVVSEILKELNTKDNLLNTAVILADEGLLLPVLQSLPNNITSVNVTMGYPLSQSPYYALFESIIKMYINLRIDNTSAYGGFYHKDVTRFLYTDAIKRMSAKDSAAVLSEFIKKITLNNQNYIKNDQLNELLSHLFRTDAVHFKEEKNTQNIVGVFKSIIVLLDQKLNTDDGLMDKINREFLLHHLEVLEQVKNMMEELGEALDMITFHKIWRHYTKLAKVQFTGEPLQGLQIMGLLESRNLDFDNVIVLNVNEGTLPADKKFGSLIPNDLKRKNGMHLHKEKDAIFSYHFYRLLQRSKNINLLYSSQLDDLGGGEKSRYIIQLEKELTTHYGGHQISEINANSPIDIVSNEAKRVEKTPYLLELITERISKGLSPTSLSTYLNCNLDFYYKYLVGIREQKDIIENFEADVLGSAIHDTLEELYTPLIGKTIAVSDIEHLQKNYKKVLQKQFETYVSQHLLFRGKNLLSFEMAKELLERFFAIEKKNVRDNRIELIALELEASRELLVEINGKNNKLILKGKIDRVEKKNGLWNLIDYKSGNIKKSDTSLKVLDEIMDGKSKALQLLTYAYLFADLHPGDTYTASLYPLKAYNLGYLPLSIEKNHLIDSSILEHYEASVIQIVKNMFDVNQAFEHNEDAQYCSLC